MHVGRAWACENPRIQSIRKLKPFGAGWFCKSKAPAPSESIQRRHSVLQSIRFAANVEVVAASYRCFFKSLLASSLESTSAASCSSRRRLFHAAFKAMIEEEQIP